jgi:hypothetical protein
LLLTLLVEIPNDAELPSSTDAALLVCVNNGIGVTFADAVDGELVPPNAFLADTENVILPLIRVLTESPNTTDPILETVFD